MSERYCVMRERAVDSADVGTTRWARLLHIPPFLASANNEDPSGSLNVRDHDRIERETTTLPSESYSSGTRSTFLKVPIGMICRSEMKAA